MSALSIVFTNMYTMHCGICSTTMKQGLLHWHYECQRCGYQASTLTPTITHTASLLLDEHDRFIGLQSLRIHNFHQLTETLRRFINGPRTLLEIGCAHGWFLDSAVMRGFRVIGIEPDLSVSRTASRRRLPILNGYFPDALLQTAVFDIIAFNDVFEHLPDVNAALEDCKAHLLPGGLLLLNLPSSKGFIYRCCYFLAKLGFSKFFERMWQSGLPSPHLHYFETDSLHTLLAQLSFQIVHSGHLSTLHLKGLYQRISHVGGILPCCTLLLIWGLLLPYLCSRYYLVTMSM